MNIATFGSQKFNPSIICCQHYIHVWNLIFINFSWIRASVPLMDVSSDSAHNFFNQWHRIASAWYALLHIHETATWCHWLKNLWAESLDISMPHVIGQFLLIVRRNSGFVCSIRHIVTRGNFAAQHWWSNKHIIMSDIKRWNRKPDNAADLSRSLSNPGFSRSVFFPDNLRTSWAGNAPESWCPRSKLVTKWNSSVQLPQWRNV